MLAPKFDEMSRYVLDRLERELPVNLYYHGVHHTRDDVYPAVKRLAAMIPITGEDRILLLTGVLYHDIGYTRQYENNEQIASDIAAETLPGFGYSPSQIKVISGIIMATLMPQSPRTLLEEAMCDGDLDSLGREDFMMMHENLWRERSEYGVLAPLERQYAEALNLLETHAYFTEAANQLRAEGKRVNSAKLSEILREMSSSQTNPENPSA